MKELHIPNITGFIRGAWPVSEAALELLVSRLTPQNFPRRTNLVREGVLSGNAWFIEEGMTRSYWMVDGDEITTSFTTSGSIVFSMDEVYYGIASKEYVESIGPVTAYRISVSDLRDLVSSNLDLCNWWRVIHQNEYRRIHRSHKERLTLDAANRYEQFSLQFPEVARMAPLNYIASYLGINPSTLSRIRRRAQKR